MDPKSAVKKLTKAITEALIKLTINAPDWSVADSSVPISPKLMHRTQGFATCRYDGEKDALGRREDHSAGPVP